ncbi:MAG: hypothetical protein H0U69_03510 [Trueperaceae bacterium]|nr:hypothetical protein [Trueperaceae bacterium]
MNALRWSVRYWHGDDRFSTVDSATSRWRALPVDGVVWVHVWNGAYRHELKGMDNYWLMEDVHSYGLYNDPESLSWYANPAAPQAFAFVWPTPETAMPLANARPPARVHTLIGVMMPDSLARAEGIL